MMMRSITLTLLFLATALSLAGQDQSIILTIGDKQVSEGEFEWMYYKNRSGTSTEVQSREAYLQTYIDFKLKIKDAEDRGMDKAPEFIKELEEYRVQLVDSYLPHQISEDELVREAYQRSKLDVNASHILIMVPPAASPADTLAAYEKISKIRQRIIDGENFETVARETSEDPSVNINGGNLYYFTLFSMPYPFETMAYETALHTISPPFRSGRGYHILMPNDRRPAFGQIKIAHIFVSSTEESSAEEKKAAKQKITEAYESLYRGIEFGLVAREYSEDSGSVNQGGELVWAGVGEMFPEFEDKAFGLEGINEISPPFKSSHGWHIVKLLDRNKVGSFEEMRPFIVEKLRVEHRLEYIHNQHIAKIKKENGFYEFPDILDIVYSSADNTLLTGNWDGGKLREDPTPLIQIGMKIVPVSEFVSYIVENQNPEARIASIKHYVDRLYGQFREYVILNYEKAVLPEKHPEMIYLLKEYHDGLLLFEIMDKQVWSKALTDTVGLKGFHEDHKQDYMWKERTDAIIVTCSKETEIEKVRKKYKKIQTGQYDAIALNNKYCDNDTVACITVSHVLTEKGIYDKVDSQKNLMGPGPIYINNHTNGFVIINELKSPEPKQLAEVRGQVISDYQKFLEIQWISELRQKYPVKVNKSALSGL